MSFGSVHSELQAYRPPEGKVLSYDGGLGGRGVTRRVRKESEDDRIEVDGGKGEKERGGAKTRRWRARVTEWTEMDMEVQAAGGEACFAVNLDRSFAPLAEFSFESRL